MFFFSCDGFKLALGIWLYISAVLLTSARAHLFVNHLAEFSRIESLCKPMFIILPMQYIIEAIFANNIDCWYMLEPPP